MRWASRPKRLHARLQKLPGNSSVCDARLYEYRPASFFERAPAWAGDRGCARLAPGPDLRIAGATSKRAIAWLAHEPRTPARRARRDLHAQLRGVFRDP